MSTQSKCFFSTHFQNSGIVLGFPRCTGEAEDAAGPSVLPALPGGGEHRPQGGRLDHAGLPKGVHTQGKGLCRSFRLVIFVPRPPGFVPELPGFVPGLPGVRPWTTKVRP